MCSRDLGRDIVLALFADDVTVLSRDSNHEQAAEGAQLAVNIINDWSKDWRLTLNATKSEVTFFSTWSHEANHQPVITIYNKKIPFNPTPKLLGVIYDRTLSFQTHVKEVTRSASSKLGMLGSVSNSKWGWDKQHLIQLYYAYLRTKMDYSGPGWQPWLSDTAINNLERCQNKAL